MRQVNILLVDGSTLFRQGLKQLLPSEFNVAGEARDFREALEVLRQGATPELILVDCPAPTVQEAVSELGRAAPAARIVYLADVAELGRLRAALEGGAAGYITKDRSPEALVQQLRLVLMGEKVFPADLAQQLVMGGGTREVFESHKGLSQRENQILRCLLEGQSNKMIALKLNITEATVKVHLKSLLRKINASNRTQAAIWAMNNGISAMEAAA
ncbi:LuxR C-terminal-related transcriptional regulator [Indioceanicola profundi]|uniref:LuxR C-terminal-related transcriptional regulator n=1 Tax=Indioceanicola profundi TaxID=2220096 RepID=UPI000E6AE008|nr:response regulator transcription factor [Indioceanicola profundi]